MDESDFIPPEQQRPRLAPPTAVPAAFDEGRRRATDRSDSETASRLAAWSIALGLIGIVTFGASAAVGVVLGISSLMKRRTTFGWVATSVSAICTLVPIGGCVWWMMYVRTIAQSAMINFAQPTLQASSDLAQWHDAFVAAKVTDDAPAVWSIKLIRERNPNTLLAPSDPWNNPYQLEASGPYEFRSFGSDGVADTADDIVIDTDGIVRTIDAGDGSNLPPFMPYAMAIDIPPATTAELALLNEEETGARFQLILDCMKLGGGTPELREELAFLASQRARLRAEAKAARETVAPK